jgi:hypothetical protein
LEVLIPPLDYSRRLADDHSRFVPLLGRLINGANSLEG